MRTHLLLISFTLSAFVCYTDSFAQTGIITPKITVDSEMGNHYDIDGDGIIEVYNPNYFYSLDKSTGNATSVSENLRGLGNYSNVSGLAEFNNDGNIDCFRTFTTGSYNDGYENFLEYQTLLGLGKGNCHKDTFGISAQTDLVVLDFDNDGYPDITHKNDFGYTLLPDGEFIERSVSIMTESEYNGVINYNKLRNGRTLISQSYGSALNSKLTVTMNATKVYNPPIHRVNSKDINGDGIADYVKGKQVLINTGNDKIIYNQLSGECIFVDVNNDGIADILELGQEIYIHFSRKNGEWERKRIYTGFTHNGGCWNYDFDKDGDIDLLIAYDYCGKLTYSNDPGGSYLLLMENIGNEQFKCHENYYSDHMHFVACVDFDSDGNYEVICNIDDIDGEDADGYYTGHIGYLNVNGTKISESILDFDTPLICQLKSKPEYCTSAVIDIDNSGILYIANSWALMPLSATANERPERPQAPITAYDPSCGFLKINWEEGKDKETPGCDLTYALRIGTEPGKGDILYAHALADGTRRNLIGGNQERNRFRMLNTNSWPAGKYYISVQAIDPNNRGSQFSEETIFEKAEPAVSFDLIHRTPFCIGDTCVIRLHHNVDPQNTLKWSIDGGKIIGSEDDGMRLQLLFNESGEKRISLQVTDEKGNTSMEYTRTIGVEPCNTAIIDPIMAQGAFDMDEDGNMEFYESKNTKFYTCNADGTFSPINKMYNNNSGIFNGTPFDINKDGKCDRFGADKSGFYGGGYTVSSLINEGDKMMSINNGIGGVNVPSNWQRSGLSTFCDIDNDGNLDYIYSYRAELQDGGEYTTYLLKGNYGCTSFTEVAQIANFSGSINKDYNNDGLIDFTRNEYDKNTKLCHLVLYANNGDFTFTRSDTIFSYDSNNTLAFDDYDNNGKYDILCQNDENKLRILWDDGTETVFEGITSIAREGEYLFDINNDGTRDFIFSKAGVNNDIGVTLLFSDHSYRFVKTANAETYSLDAKEAFVTPTGDIAIESLLLKTQNSRPAAPTNISVGKSDKGISISWTHSTDKETPQIRMKYNLSVKRKGASGENAYIISPCNSTKNGVHVPSNKQLICGNRFFIPTASIPAGEYEIQVQAVDGQMLESDFSELYMLTVQETTNIEAPARSEVGAGTIIGINSNIAESIDWDGGEVISQEGTQYTVVWNSEGNKTITAGDEKCHIYIQAKPDISFEIPDVVLGGATVKVPAANAKDGEWEIAGDDGRFTSFGKNGAASFTVINNDSAVAVFNKAGKYTVRHSIKSDYNTSTYEKAVEVSDMHTTAEISLLTVQDGKIRIALDIPQDLPEEITGINIYKETTLIDDYTLIASIDKSQSSYIDETSTPDIQAARYRVSYVTTYGESAMGTPHQSMHVMINRGIGTSWNLAWTKYEGCTVESYRILRGATPESLESIAEVSGNMNSYSDSSNNADAPYYAVEMVIPQRQESRGTTRAASSDNTARSNIASTENAYTVVFAEDINIIGKESFIAGEDEALALTAAVSPYHATYQGVNWTIESGKEIAVIDESGRIMPAGNKENGKVVVRAYALDGSQVYGEFEIEFSGFLKFHEQTVVIDNASATPNSITISWQPVDEAEYYTLTAQDYYMGEPVPGYENLNIGNVTQYTIEGLSPSVQYLFKVKAHKGDMETEYSQGKRIYTTTTEFTSQTVQLKECTDITTTSFKINWEPVTGAVGYYLSVYQEEWYEEAGEYKSKRHYIAKDIYITGNTHYNISKLTSYDPNNRFYTYEICAYDGTYRTSYTIGSEETRIEFMQVILKEPTNITENSFTINWEPIEGATEYYVNVYRSSDNQWVFDGSTSDTGIAVTVPVVYVGKYEHYYTVKACDVWYFTQESRGEVTLLPTGIEETAGDTELCYVENGAAVVETGEVANIAIYATDGNIIEETVQRCETKRYPLPGKGVYIISINGKMKKVVN